MRRPVRPADAASKPDGGSGPPASPVAPAPSVLIDPRIAHASTLPGRIYSDAAAYAVQRDRVFARAWHFIGEAERVKAPGHVLPFTLLPGCLNEPLVLAREDDGVLYRR